MKHAKHKKMAKFEQGHEKKMPMQPMHDKMMDTKSKPKKRGKK